MIAQAASADMKSFVWEEFCGVENNPAVSAHPFKAKQGVSAWILAREPKNAVDYFRIFWDRDITRHVCYQTNI